MTNLPCLIPDDVLHDMASACAGDTKAIHRRLTEYSEQNKLALNIAIFKAQSGITRSILSEGQKLKRKYALKLIDELIKQGCKLQESFQETITPNPESPFSGLGDYLESYFYTPTADNEAPDDYLRRINNWESFSITLEEQISTFKKIKKNIKAQQKSGRPNTLNGLTAFIYEIAICYEKITGRKFTVDEHRTNSIPVPITEGMKFAEEALKALYSPSQTKAPHFLLLMKENAYTPSNFQNACAEALKRLRQSEKP